MSAWHPQIDWLVHQLHHRTGPWARFQDWTYENITGRWTHTKSGMELTRFGRWCNVYHRITRWVRVGWWAYVLDKPSKRNQTDYWRVVWCRLRGHPSGPIYYSSGIEPDPRCSECLEVIP